MMTINFKGRQINAIPWQPSMGMIGGVFGYDTETVLIQGPADVPDYVIGTAYNGKEAYFITRQDLRQFWDLHNGCRVYVHTAAFDLAVTTKASGFDFAFQVEVGQIVDVSILYRLLMTAVCGDVPPKYNLTAMTEQFIGETLVKDDGSRVGFGQFIKDGVVDYAAIPIHFLEYAARDAVATFWLGRILEDECRAVHPSGTSRLKGPNVQESTPFGLLGHDIQLRGSIALHAVMRLGIGVDPDAVEVADQELVSGIGENLPVLARHGYVPGAKGVMAVFDRVVGGIAKERGVLMPTTPKGLHISQREDDLQQVADHEFVDAFIKHKQRNKLRTTYIEPLRAAGTRAYPRYNLLVRTGRTSCSKPNVQNLPRGGCVRGCVVPAPGHVLVACDYSTLELCALAQICYWRYGESHMRDLINQGIDLHRYVAARILGKPEVDVTKEERQKSKAVSFGLPGGMGTNGLRGYAWFAYGVLLTQGEAESWRTAWMDLFPEMQNYLAPDDRLGRLAEIIDLDTYPGGRINPLAAAGIIMRVAGGKFETSRGRLFSSAEIDWAWEQIAEGPAGQYSSMKGLIEERNGGSKIQRLVVPGTTVSIPTGRVKSNCRYTQEHNWLFQGLSADGAKLALYELMRAGYRVVAFIHDEVLVEVPERADYREPAEDISRIMVEAMRQVCPDVEIRTEFAVMRRWDKAAKALYDAKGQLIPFG